MADKISPGMQQYLDIKKDFPDAFLLFRMGDFYELFYEDAVNAAQILELTLTSRNKTSENPVPMAGVPHHTVAEYIEKLVALGYKVAVADQMEDPKAAKGIVKRAVTQVITPGTAVDERVGNDNNFLVALTRTGGTDKDFELAYVDLATGESRFTELTDFATVAGEISNLQAREIVVADDMLSADEKQFLEKQLNVLLSVENEGTTATDKLMAYVEKTQLRDLSHLQTPVRYALTDFLQMDHATKTALELTVNKREGKKYGTLYGLLDATKTAMGTRLLRTWIERPLINLSEITQRQEIVTSFIKNFFERADLIEALKGVYDLERLASRLSFGKAVPVDLLQLAHSLGNVPAIKQVLETLTDENLQPLTERLDTLTDLRALIDAAIDPAAARIITDGNIIKTGYDTQLDKYREALTHGTQWIADLEATEREKTGISGLRIDYNRQDGYYFHVTASQLTSVPAHFIYKKALKNATRYTTKELSEIEETMLEARSSSSKLEYDIFQSIRNESLQYIPRLQKLAATIAEIDCLQSLATVAETHGYVRPQLTENSREVTIIAGRHAVIEAVMSAQSYVPNDVLLPETTDMQLITGPNMSGKSTYMRQLALTVVMAQIGSFVAADSAALPVFDAIFTRIGASDDLISGESTFMVEMSEANHAIQQATSRSLILFDELGRGTATYDGMALAQAIIEYIHEHIHAKTLFATHYHELTALDKTLSQLTNVHVATLEKNGEVTFLHKIAEGPADKSYGIHVAKIAGLPQTLLLRADIILQKLENQAPELALTADNEQLSLFEPDPSADRLKNEIASLDILNLTPLEALNKLQELKDLL